MTVKEYILALQQLPQEAEVVIDDDHLWRVPVSSEISLESGHREPNGTLAQHYDVPSDCEGCNRAWPLVQVVVL